jgi:hypothetical protein
MKNLFLFCLGILLLACNKGPLPHPPDQYTNFHDTTFGYRNHLAIDINKDGTEDFYATTAMVYVGGKSRLQFKIVALNNNKILFNGNEPKLLNDCEMISPNSALPLQWMSHNSALLQERVFMTDPKDDYWQGAWHEKRLKYLAIALKQNNSYYYGWLRISSKTADTPQMILHDAKISLEANEGSKTEC